MTVTTRTSKGTALTYAEMDANLSSLDSDRTVFISGYRPALPCANVSLSTDTLGANTAYDAVMIFNIANLNQGNHYNTTNGKFTCPVAGIYQVTAFAMDKNSSAAGAFYLRVKVNGTAYGSDAGSYTASNSHAGAHISKLVSCTAGQELTVTYSSTNGVHAGYSGATFMLIG